MAKSIIDDLINMDYESLINLSKKENLGTFKTILKHMVTQSNRRISSLNKSPIGKYSPSLKALKDAKIKKFDLNFVKNATTKDIGKLLNLYSTTKKFLKAKSSTISGWNKIRKSVGKRIGSDKLFRTEFKSKRQATYWHNKEKGFWNLYNKLVDEFGGIITELDSDRIQKMLYKVQNMKMPKGVKNDDYIRNIMETYIDKLYQAKQSNKVLRDEDFEEEIRISFKE